MSQRTDGTALRGALLVAGTTSDAGKSALVAGICRWLVRQGVSVAPFKAQNMSNNSVVTVDGGEIGRAQAMQAHACGLAPSVAFNPVLLKPGSDRSSQVGQGRGDDLEQGGLALPVRHRADRPLRPPEHHHLRRPVAARLEQHRVEPVSYTHLTLPTKA